VLTRQERYMMEALALAREAAAAGEVPVGCVIVRGDEIVGRGRNRREEKRATASHAEMEAIAEANAALGSWRLDDCELYVTLEPCPMCAGAILNARVARVWYGARDEAFGAYDSRAGSLGSVIDLPLYPYNHRPTVEGGVMEGEAKALLQDFFRAKR